MVLVDEAAESITTLDPAGFKCRWRVGRAERPAAMRTLSVVVLEVLDKHPAQVVLGADQDPVEALAADRPDDAFRVPVRDRRPDHTDRFGGEDGIESAGKLRVAITDQEPELLKQAGPGEVPCLLGDPGTG